MPIYEYRCQDCSQEFERMQRFSDPPVDTCPKCSGPVQRLISRSAFHLKGGGWYVTDYGRNGSKAEKSAKGDGESSSKASESSSSESSSSKSSTSESTSSTPDNPSTKSTASAAA